MATTNLLTWKKLFSILPYFIFVAAAHGQSAPAKVDPKEEEAAHELSFLHQCFPKDGDAITNGQQVLALLDKHLELKQGLYLPDELQAFVDKPIALVGGGATPGSSNDMVTGNNVYLRIITEPFRDLRYHHAPMWSAAFCGTIQGFVLANRIIVIKVSKKNWVIYRAM